MTTAFIVQSFKKRGRKLVSEPAVRTKTLEDAIAKAKLAAGSRAGVVAYTVEFDEDVDYWGDPKILFRDGELPVEFDDF